jgi:RNA polymerase sigma factor (sigma-70 family)
MGDVVPLRRIAGEVHELSDEALVFAAGAGDPAALGALFDRFAADVHRFVIRIAGRFAADVDDLAQATFLEVYRSSARFNRRSSVKTWMFGIAINVVRHHRRSEGRRRHARALRRRRRQRGGGEARYPDRARPPARNKQLAPRARRHSTNRCGSPTSCASSRRSPPATPRSRSAPPKARSGGGCTGADQLHAELGGGTDEPVRRRARRPARELPAGRPDPARLEQMRTEILAAAGTVTPLAPRMFGPRAVVATSVAAIAVAAAVVGGRGGHRIADS